MAVAWSPSLWSNIRVWHLCTYCSLAWFLDTEVRKLTKRHRCSAIWKVTVGLAAHWPCVTRLCGDVSTYGLKGPWARDELLSYMDYSQSSYFLHLSVAFNYARPRIHALWLVRLKVAVDRFRMERFEMTAERSWTRSQKPCSRTSSLTFDTYWLWWLRELCRDDFFTHLKSPNKRPISFRRIRSARHAVISSLANIGRMTVATDAAHANS